MNGTQSTVPPSIVQVPVVVPVELAGTGEKNESQRQTADYWCSNRAYF